MSTSTHAANLNPLDLETLIGEARDYCKILSVLVSHLLESVDHKDGNLIYPLNAEDEQAIVFASILASDATRKLYNQYHGIEVGGAS